MCRPRLLIVHDEPAVGRALEAGLCMHFETWLVGSAAAALALLDQERVDLIVSGLVMPGMTGNEFVEQVEQRIPHMRYRVLFMSGGSGPTQADDLAAVLLRHRIDKPYELLDLRDVLSGMLPA